MWDRSEPVVILEYGEGKRGSSQAASSSVPPPLAPLVGLSRLVTLFSPATQNKGKLRCRNYGCNQYFNEEDNRFVDELYQYLSGSRRFRGVVMVFARICPEV